MTIDKPLLDRLTELAKQSPRLRMHYDLRDSVEDGSQRMLNAIEPGTVIGVHRHKWTSETVAVLRGTAEEVFFDELGNETGRFRLTPGGLAPGTHAALQIPIGQYHTIRSLESGTVIIAFKNGRYEEKRTKELL